MNAQWCGCVVYPLELCVCVVHLLLDPHECVCEEHVLGVVSCVYVCVRACEAEALQ